MITAYLTCISTLYEGEDIEIRYSIFEDGELLKKKSFFEKYTKPALCGLLSVQKLLKHLEDHKEDEILVVINDGALLDILNGTSMTKKQEVQMQGKKVRALVEEFSDISFKNVSGNHSEVQEWSTILKP